MLTPKEYAAQFQQYAQALSEKLDAIHKIAETAARLYRERTNTREPFYETVGISSSAPIVLDYRDRKHIFIWSANSLTISLEDIGTLSLSANAWTNISFRPGLNLLATGQSSVVYVLIKQTDETVP